MVWVKICMMCGLVIGSPWIFYQIWSFVAAGLYPHEKRPVLLVISTPTYCVSLFCGPVTDMVAGLAKDYANRARFIHIEVWKDYKAQQLNDAAKEWIARGEDINEPWVFLIGADGKITARFDNVVTRSELEPLIQKLPPKA